MAGSTTRARAADIAQTVIASLLVAAIVGSLGAWFAMRSDVRGLHDRVLKIEEWRGSKFFDGERFTYRDGQRIQKEIDSCCGDVKRHNSEAERWKAQIEHNTRAIDRMLGVRQEWKH